MPQVNARFRCCALQIKIIKRFSKYPADDNEQHPGLSRAGACSGRVALLREVGFANFPEQGNPPGAGPLDRFDMRGLILFYAVGTLLTLPWKPCIELWSAKITLPGPGRHALF